MKKRVLLEDGTFMDFATWKRMNKVESAPKEVTPKVAATIDVPVEDVKAEPIPENLEELTVKELKGVCDDHWIKYPKSVTKAGLIGLLKPEEDVEI